MKREEIELTSIHYDTLPGSTTKFGLDIKTGNKIKMNGKKYTIDDIKRVFYEIRLVFTETKDELEERWIEERWFVNINNTWVNFSDGKEISKNKIIILG